MLDAQYEYLLRKVRYYGDKKTDRTGTGTVSLFGAQLRYDLAKGFPLVTTKKVYTKAIIAELLWFLRGDTNIKWLHENQCTIWDEWADDNGDLGPVYGAQWRSWPTPNGEVDQIALALHDLKHNPDSRRIVVSAWNVSQLDAMALMPCHALFQFYTSERNGRRRLSCQLYQRSADLFLGVPFNIASYALLTHMVAQQCDMDVGEFIWTGGDCHVYSNHYAAVDEQLSRQPYDLCRLNIKRKPESIDHYQPDDFEFLDYRHHAPIKAPVAV